MSEETKDVVFRTKRRNDRSTEEKVHGRSNPQGKSVAKPNEARSIRELLQRNINGLDFDVTKTPYYEEEAKLSGIAFNKVQHMDFGERARYYEEVSELTADISSQIKEHQKKVDAENKAKAEAKAKRLKLIDEHLSSIADDKSSKES